MRDTFIFYRSFKDSMSELSEKDKLIMYEAISDYSLDMVEPELTGFPKALFSLIRPILDANIQRWKNGRKGGAPIGNLNAKKTTKKQPKNNRKTTEKQANKDKDVNKDKEYNIESGDKSERFVIPSLKDIKLYFEGNNLKGDYSAFHDHYQANGWKVGASNPMKDRKAAARSWSRKETNFHKTTKTSSADVGMVLKDNSSEKYVKGW